MGPSASLLLLLVLVATVSNAAGQFINEIHYDNVATDVGEAIEIAAPSASSLSGWRVELYDGLSNKLYNATTLSGFATSSADGWGYVVVRFPRDGLQNGAPDGLALVSAGGTVTEFLSYEGSFVAEDGSAAGMTSVDIGVQQSFGTQENESLQRVGMGASAEDFVWIGPVISSFGSRNAGQRFTGMPTPSPTSSPGAGSATALGQVFVNEVHYNNVGADVSEGVEIAAPAGTDLSGFSISVYRTTGFLLETRQLSGTVPNQERGWGVVFIAWPRLANLPAIALTQNVDNTVLDFFSTGSRRLRARDGPAQGSRSVSLPFEENNSTPVGRSLQRRGLGRSRDEFRWVSPRDSSFGAVNKNQRFRRRLST